MRKINIFLFISILGCIFISSVWVDAAVDFPTKPIHIWVGFQAGGSTDIFTRAVSNIAEKALKQPIVVENRPGGGGSVCLGLLKSAKPDGYTLGAITDSPLTRNPHITKVNYDPMKDFDPIIQLGIAAAALVVKSDSPFKEYQDLIAYARNNPGKLTIGVTGKGTSGHVGMEKVAQLEKVKFQYVFFPGAAPATTALLGGHVMSANVVSVNFMPHVKAGSLRVMISNDKEGIEEMPEVPTLDKLYNFHLSITQVIVAPKGVPKSIIDKLTSAFTEASMSAEFQQLARKQGLIGKPLFGEALVRRNQTEFESFAIFIKELGIMKKD